MNKIIFVHVPKTGGTTINTAMKGAAWQTLPDFNYRHIELKTKASNAGDIFDGRHMDKYQSYKIFTMLRHPVDRLLSEYYFIKERKNFMELFQKEPKTLKSYIRNKQTNNGVVNFLKGRRMYDPQIAREEDLEDIIDAIESLPICIGIFEEFAKSLDHISQYTGLQWNKEIEVKRMTFRRPKAERIKPEIREMILEHNQLDLALYNYALEKFNTVKPKLKAPQVIFNKDKYAHVIPYATQMCFFEYCMEHKKFIKSNFQFFKDLTFYLLKEKQVKNGRQFVTLWNATFVNAINNQFPNSDFATLINDKNGVDADGLETTYQLAKGVDSFFKQNSFVVQSYYQALQFNSQLVPNIKEDKAMPKKSFFSRLFKK